MPWDCSSVPCVAYTARKMFPKKDLLIESKSSKTLKWWKQLSRLLCSAPEDDLFKTSFANEVFNDFRSRQIMVARWLSNNKLNCKAFNSLVPSVARSKHTVNNRTGLPGQDYPIAKPKTIDMNVWVGRVRLTFNKHHPLRPCNCYFPCWSTIKTRVLLSYRRDGTMVRRSPPASTAGAQTSNLTYYLHK